MIQLKTLFLEYQKIGSICKTNYTLAKMKKRFRLFFFYGAYQSNQKRGLVTENVTGAFQKSYVKVNHANNESSLLFL